MKNITIVGAGAAGLSFIEALRAKEGSVKITLINLNSFGFIRGDLLSLNLKKRINLTEWCNQRKIEFISDRLERINPNRSKIYLKEGNALDYETLIIATGLASCKSEIKGEHREGFCYLDKLEPYLLRDLLKISQETILYISTWLGMRLAFSLKNIGKEVRVLAGNWDFLAEYKERFINALKAQEIMVHFDYSLDEAIGEGVVKAVKLKPLKVFSADLLLVDSGFSANRQALEDSGPDLSSFSNICIIGDADNQEVENERFFAYNYENSINQAKQLVESLVASTPYEFNRKVISDDDKKKIMEDFLANVEIKETIL